MGLDLTLGIINPVHGDEGGGRTRWLAYDRLSLDRDYALFGPLGSGDTDYGEKVIRTWELGPFDYVRWYGDEGLEERSNDPYGTTLTYTVAGEFAKIEPGERSEWNTAVFAFLAALPPRTPVVLWWS